MSEYFLFGKGGKKSPYGLAGGGFRLKRMGHRDQVARVSSALRFQPDCGSHRKLFTLARGFAFHWLRLRRHEDRASRALGRLLLFGGPRAYHRQRRLGHDETSDLVAVSRQNSVILETGRYHRHQTTDNECCDKDLPHTHCPPATIVAVKYPWIQCCQSTFILA